MNLALVLWFVSCTTAPESGLPDPREEIAGRLQGRSSSGNGKALLRADNAPAACDAFAQAIRNRGGEAEWRGLVVASARSEGCLSIADGDALCAWAKGKSAWVDACGEWESSRGRPVDVRALGPAARFRVALRGTDHAAAVEAAEGALLENQTEVAACRFLAADTLARNDLRDLEALPPCGSGPQAARPRGIVLDRAGQYLAAVNVLVDAADPIRAAAILYQSVGGADANVRAAELLVGSEPPVVLHRAWMAILDGKPASLDGLDGSPEGTMVRALSGDAAAIARLQELPGPQASVLAARLTGDFSNLDHALEAEPDAEPLLRANIGVRLAAKKDAAEAIARWTGRDPDHVRLRGGCVNRDQPWAAIVPWSWAELRAQATIGEPTGTDAVGDAYRAARALTGAARVKALDALQVAHPELDGLAAERYAAQP